MIPFEIHLFGARTVAGESFRRLIISQTSPFFSTIFSYSRSVTDAPVDYHFADLACPSHFSSAGDISRPKVWISFAPIWLFSSFLFRLVSANSSHLQGLRGVIACSSSSVITKRHCFNKFDRELVSSLESSEDLIIESCLRLGIACRILRPSLIYGQVGPYRDLNLSRLLQQMRRFPVLPLPAQSGFRQPIHASQLSAVAFHLIQQLLVSDTDSSFPERISIGGDSTLRYDEMISALQAAQPLSDPARRCRLLPIPNRLFFFLAAPLLLRSPRFFEAVLRMGANLSGFIPSHQLLGSEPKPFPVLPLS